MIGKYVKNDVRICDIFTVIMFAGLIFYSFHRGWTGIDVTMNVDPSVFIREANEIAKTNELITSRDPPFRYIPLAIIYKIMSPTGLAAERVASLHAALFGFVIVPLSVYILGYSIEGEYIAILSVLAFVLARFVGFGSYGFDTGAWQYEIALPFVFLTLAMVHKSVITNKKWAIGAGITLGILGLTQYTLALFTIIPITTVYLYKKRYQNLVYTGLVAGGFSNVLLFLPPSGTEMMAGGLLERILPESSHLFDISDIILLVLSPGVWIVLLCTCTILIYQSHQGYLITDSGVLSISIVVIFPIYIIPKIAGLNYLDWAASQVLLPILYISASSIFYELLKTTPYNISDG